MAGALFRIDGGQPQAPFLGPLVPLFTLSQANMNVTTDQPFLQTFNFDQYVLRACRVYNSSTSLTTAQGAIYGTAAKAAPILFGSTTQVFTGATGVNNSGQEIAVAATGAGLLTFLAATAARQTANALTFPGLFATVMTPILALTTAQGGAATADLVIYGHAVSLF